MNVNQKKQLDRYSMMIVSKYFKNIGDFIKMIRICKKFKEIPEMFHYNPVKLMKKTNLFPNIETYHVYHKNEKVIKGYNKYIYWNKVVYEAYLKKKENEEFKNVGFNLEDSLKFDSFKGATILYEKSLSYVRLIEIDLTGVTKLEKNCFYGNTTVKYIKLDKRISIIPDDCFLNCSSLVELDLSYIKILGNYCFHCCRSLTALTLPEMLYENGDNCFYGLNYLKKIETKGVKVIKSNMNYSLFNSFKTNGIDVKGTIAYETEDKKRYNNEIPEGVSIVSTYCFNNETTLGDVILPKSVTKLDFYCFYFCSIKSIDLSNVIENKCIFEGCRQLTSITLNNYNIQTLLSNTTTPFYNKLVCLKNIELTDTNHIPIVSNHLRILMEKKGYKYDKCIYTKEDSIETNSIIPDEVNIIGDVVFGYGNNLQTVTIPSKVTHILSGNFYSMPNLEILEIQSTNLQCEYNCFINLPKIKELNLRGMSSLGNNCLFNCPCLTKVITQNIPFENGFYGCDSLKEIEIIGIKNNEYEHPINYKVAEIFEKKGIHCKTKVFCKYERVNDEETYSVPYGVNEIAAYAFDRCEAKEIIIPSTVTLIKSYAFYCLQLTHLVIEGDPKIQQNAFCQCEQLIQNQPELR